MQECGYVCRVILAITIHSDDQRAMGLMNARRECSALSNASLMPDRYKPAAQAISGAYSRSERTVAAAIIHQHDFETGMITHNIECFSQQGGDVVLFVFGGNYH
ncbi:hypothetical protein GCM10008110_02730 [Marinobacter persicus]|nr:hypothetical protein GCM10008110_02730 [Marinobacter persicus]